jgi:hypothetical protein
MKRQQQRYLWCLASLLLATLAVFFIAPRSAAAPRRPQTPVPPLQYAVQEVAFDNAGSKIRLSGTLTLPPGAGPHPAIVLIPGSGPVDRDGSVLGHQFYLVLADHLTRQGFAVLRNDKRGLGKSEGDFAAATRTEPFFPDRAERRAPGGGGDRGNDGAARAGPDRRLGAQYGARASS